MIKTEGVAIHRSGRSFAPSLMIDDDRYIATLRELAGVIHAEGAAAILQLHHGGRSCRSVLTGRAPMAASAVLGPLRGDEMPIPMSPAEIAVIVTAYGAAAERAREAGFDGWPAPATPRCSAHTSQ